MITKGRHDWLNKSEIVSAISVLAEKAIGGNYEEVHLPQRLTLRRYVYENHPSIRPGWYVLHAKVGEYFFDTENTAGVIALLCQKYNA